MLIRSDAAIERERKGGIQEAVRERMKAWVLEQIKDSVYVREHEISPANSERQLGRYMTSAEFEQRLKKKFPNLHFEVNPFNPTKKALYVIDRRGKTYICSYENGFMPEHSIMKIKEIEVPDLDILRQKDPVRHGLGHIERKDLPKSEFDPKQGFIAVSTGLKPGFKKVAVPWGEVVRGWRTVLVKLVLANVTTPAEVEAIFGAANRREWAEHMGKREKTLPW